jgi:hypothetical protein
MSSIIREIYALWSNSGALSKHIQQISSAQGKKVDLAFAKAAIVGMYPFSLYKSREMEAAFAKLGSYKPPSRKKVGGVRFQIRLSRRFDSVFGMRFGSLETLLISSPTEARILMETVFKTLVLLPWMACHSTGIPLI